MSEENTASDKKVVHADPTKDFFVDMVTRDIELEDCIFDFLDNAVDGARRTGPAPDAGPDHPLRGYRVDISLDKSSFEIKDNCGGIRLSDAIDYAFHFGRRTDAPLEVAGGIGLYGIGMKRGIFKIGRKADVISEAEDACFRVYVDVNQWVKDKENWDFEYFDHIHSGTRGTTIKISELNAGIDTSFSDPVFRNNLVRLIARDYSFFIDMGLSIFVCGHQAPSFRFNLKSDENLQPAVQDYVDDGVNIRIVMGLVDELPDDIPEEFKPDKVERFGWFVVCNDRVVLAADKSEKTIWGDDGYNVWHPQYNGIAGFVFFHAADQRKLPWTTTKREVDAAHPLYRRTVTKMKTLTDEFIAYSNRRKADLENAKLAEQAAKLVDLLKFDKPQALRLPSLSQAQARPEYVYISYRRKVDDVQQIRVHLGRRSMSARDVGIHTFEYFQKMELGK